ncbi:hypothetical protein QBC34DRAFT_443640 [Podospora aff. communis PSN243]|uniref:Secreted protein n=1 Tax=Podospora aff. communis PSN243 TaxID=3040156 RepID=A0AAV9G7D8_9PEZI|nr:hypothetical protein QBC34DRAFT_443640 [Podospora aff. communis PSN243]
MHFHYLLPIAALTAALAAAQEHIALQCRESEPPNVEITEIAFAGSGCPAGYAPGQTLSDPSTLILPATSFTAESGKNKSNLDARTNCQILVKLHYPSDWQFSVSKADYYGRVQVPDGMTAVSKTTYYFTGDPTSNDVSYNTTVLGPYDGSYFRNDRFGETNSLWSPCGSEAMLNINSEVRLSPVGTGQTAVIGVYTQEKVDISWRTCG